MMSDEAEPAPTGGADLELAIRQVAARPNEDGTYVVLLRTTRGEIPCLLHPCEGGTAAAVFVSGASGGVDGPAEKIYERLAVALVGQGISSLRLDYRQPGEFDECVLDALGGLSFLRGIGAERVVLVGHSFGGAVAIKAGELSDRVCGVVAMSSQLYGTNAVANLAPRPLLLVHGMDDQVLEASASQIIYDRAAEPKELVLYEGAGHGLQSCHVELYDLLTEWIVRTAA
ncbi:MAG: alpha/beta hydrolase [Dehalococcoidia bacterium]